MDEICLLLAQRGVRAAHGRVAISNTANIAIASSRDVPHISRSGRSEAQNPGRSGWPNNRHRSSSSNCTQGMPAGLPCGMPGIGEAIEGAMQQAPQPGRQSIGGGGYTAAMAKIRSGTVGNQRVVKVE